MKLRIVRIATSVIVTETSMAKCSNTGEVIEIQENSENSVPLLS